MSRLDKALFVVVTTIILGLGMLIAVSFLQQRSVYGQAIDRLLCGTSLAKVLDQAGTDFLGKGQEQRAPRLALGNTDARRAPVNVIEGEADDLARPQTVSHDE